MMPLAVTRIRSQSSAHVPHGTQVHLIRYPCNSVLSLGKLLCHPFQHQQEPDQVRNSSPGQYKHVRSVYSCAPK